MVNEPALPVDKELPRQVNGWIYDPTDSRNGHTWVGKEAVRSVTVYKSLDQIRVTLYDDRVDSGGGINHTRQEISNIDTSITDAVWWGIEKAVDWMTQTRPTAWEHPEVESTAFSSPPGYKLANYALGSRAHTVYYERANGKSAWEMIDADLLSESDPSFETRKYLYIKTWKGSGNSTIALAPWLRSDEHQMKEIVDPPENCGFKKAVKLCHKWVADQTNSTPLSEQ